VQPAVFAVTLTQAEDPVLFRERTPSVYVVQALS
jgi:hypothetical protein